ncbi:L domain-like protein [Dipodascopsis tothii]|uniref:L domain-like protein n=1 Tax=Dipodascopsis tothii TaxID=44089 RepID=UPI0034CF32AB
MKLTVDLVSAAPSYINPLNDRELLLRGHKIPMLENLGVTKDQNDAIDLTDNDLTHLTNIPRLIHLRRLLVARNRIASVGKTLAQAAPNLTTLVLTSNAIANLADLEGLQGLKQLEHLTLLDNPVTLKDNYRLWVVHHVPSVRILDFDKVRQAEREAAAAVYGV